MKKFTAVFCAMLMALSLAACSKESDSSAESSESQATTLDKIIVYDVPDGYEKTNEGDRTTTYAIYDENEVITHGFSVTKTVAKENQKKAFTTTDRAVMEEELQTEFEDNLIVEFVAFGDYTGIRIDDTIEGGTVTDVTYLLLVGDYVVMVTSRAEGRNMDQVNEDMQSVINSMRLEKFTFSESESVAG